MVRVFQNLPGQPQAFKPCNLGVDQGPSWGLSGVIPAPPAIYKEAAAARVALEHSERGTVPPEIQPTSNSSWGPSSPGDNTLLELPFVLGTQPYSFPQCPCIRLILPPSLRRCSSCAAPLQTCHLLLEALCDFQWT